jgi:hypothetical protein
MDTHEALYMIPQGLATCLIGSHTVDVENDE